MNPFNVIALFCDDIREEVSNKHSLIGIYPDNVNVSKIPGRFNRLAVYVRIHLDIGSKFENCSVVARMPDGEELALGGFPEPAVKEGMAQAKNNGLSSLGLVMHVNLNNVPIKAAGPIKVVVAINQEQIIAGVLNVLIKDAPSKPSIASQPPSEQSQTAS